MVARSSRSRHRLGNVPGAAPSALWDAGVGEKTLPLVCWGCKVRHKAWKLVLCFLSFCHCRFLPSTVV